ncbi:MAG: FkbM family methyltransferase, partial [Firmicutes bacterium]|nr:FkbM family methyltransferase [Bacillota bacterium]
TQLRSLDSVLGGRRAEFIKMDIEGAEHKALQGAAHTIKTFRPAMLIAAYHRTEDLFAIPQTVLSMCPDYRLFLRKDPAIPAWGVNYLFL